MKCSAAAPTTTAGSTAPSPAKLRAARTMKNTRQAEQQRRPQHLRDVLGQGHAAGQRRCGEDDGGDRRIDQPRPVHDEAAFRPHPVLMQVEPALAGQQVANLDQPQQAVIVAAGIGQLRKAGRRR